MSEQNNNNAPQSEEIDLGQLFKLIGDAFNRFFNFIGSIFKGFFNLLIAFLLFVQKHFIKFSIAGIIGIAGGWYWDYTSPDVYRSSMVVEPNFNSAQQLYNNIEFYNELAEQEEYEALKETFPALTNEEAATIKSFEIESFSDQSQKIKQFSQFIESLDTISQKQVDFEDYLRNFNNINAQFHRIIIETEDNRVAKKLQAPIVLSIQVNDYFKLQKKINDENIQLSDSLYQAQLTEIDTLQKFYREIKLKEASKEQASTSISLGGDAQQKESDELELIKQEEQIKNSLIRLNEEKANTRSTINVISDFPNKGVEINDFWKKKKVLLPILLVGLVLFFLLLMELNRYLNVIKENK
ncbi:hypothetical protein [Spongiivirga citrea]|uniref:Uncharacterized protein n=1 Tax=Spongiivirga citrea TaxID=1481457 RepID=A0A6M0CLY7_9FLAO|nr:hypothetical protein [Spongiivirga citrea]NER18901.1 hypothetical protein [Spongiivirga citrea]